MYRDFILRTSVRNRMKILSLPLGKNESREWHRPVPCVRHIVKDYQQGLKRRKDKEIPFCELPEIFVENFAVWDDYETDYTIFSVCGIDIRVLDDELAEALKKLPERKRNTLLMYYFLEMTESEIANLQKITQSGVFRNRHHALETMKKILKEKQ